MAVSDSCVLRNRARLSCESVTLVIIVLGRIRRDLRADHRGQLHPPGGLQEADTADVSQEVCEVRRSMTLSTSPAAVGSATGWAR